MKTAGELQVTDGEYNALRWVREQLSSGAIKWQDRRFDLETHWGPHDRYFNMGTIYSVDKGFHACKTAACIGGWIAHRLGYDERWDAVNFVNNIMSRAMGELCFPDPGLMSSIRPEHAVIAIDNFLNTGSPMWPSVLANVVIPGTLLPCPPSESHDDELAQLRQSVADAVQKTHDMIDLLEASILESKNLRTELQMQYDDYEKQPVQIRRIEPPTVELKRNERAWIEDKSKDKVQ